MTVLAWHLVTKDQDYAFARPGLVAHKRRKLELAAGAPSRRGNFGAPTPDTTTSNAATRRRPSSNRRPGRRRRPRSADRSRGRHPRGAKRSTSHTPRSRRRQPCPTSPRPASTNTYRRFTEPDRRLTVPNCRRKNSGGRRRRLRTRNREVLALLRRPRPRLRVGLAVSPVRRLAGGPASGGLPGTSTWRGPAGRRLSGHGCGPTRATGCASGRQAAVAGGGRRCPGPGLGVRTAV